MVVGVKMESNSHSTELLTWSLVNVAQPGDLILALHVLRNDGTYYLLKVIKCYFLFFVCLFFYWILIILFFLCCCRNCESRWEIFFIFSCQSI